MLNKDFLQSSYQVKAIFDSNTFTFPNPFKWIFCKSYKQQYIDKIINNIKYSTEAPSLNLDEQTKNQFHKILNFNIDNTRLSEHVNLQYYNKWSEKNEYHNSFKSIQSVGIDKVQNNLEKFDDPSNNGF